MAPAAPPRPYVPALRFRWLTPFFDGVLAATLPERQLKARLIAEAQVQPDDRVLDLGAGTATLGLMLEAAVPEARVVGIDGDAEVLAIGREKVANANGHVQLIEAMADDLPFRSGSFDRIVSSLVFHHLDREAKQRALAEAGRVLRPGGTLHILDWGKAQDPLMRVAYLSVQLLDGFRTTTDNVRGDLPRLVEEAGFVGVAETYRRRTLFGTLSLYRAEARGSHRRGRSTARHPMGHTVTSRPTSGSAVLVALVRPARLADPLPSEGGQLLRREESAEFLFILWMRGAGAESEGNHMGCLAVQAVAAFEGDEEGWTLHSSLAREPEERVARPDDRGDRRRVPQGPRGDLGHRPTHADQPDHLPDHRNDEEDQEGGQQDDADEEQPLLDLASLLALLHAGRSLRQDLRHATLRAETRGRITSAP